MKKIMLAIVLSMIMFASNVLVAEELPTIATYSSNGNITWLLDRDNLTDILWDNYSVTVDDVDIDYTPGAKSYFYIYAHDEYGIFKTIYFEITGTANILTGDIDLRIKDEYVPSITKKKVGTNSCTGSSMCGYCPYQEGIGCPCQLGVNCSHSYSEVWVDRDWYTLTTLTLKIVGVVASIIVLI
jgi:hypothetical protein